MTYLRIVIRSNLLFEHDLFGKPVSTFRIMLWDLCEAERRVS
jgi:hypothetical protein